MAQHNITYVHAYTHTYVCMYVCNTAALIIALSRIRFTNTPIQQSIRFNMTQQIIASFEITYHSTGRLCIALHCIRHRSRICPGVWIWASQGKDGGPHHRQCVYRTRNGHDGRGRRCLNIGRGSEARAKRSRRRTRSIAKTSNKPAYDRVDDKRKEQHGCKVSLSQAASDIQHSVRAPLKGDQAFIVRVQHAEEAANTWEDIHAL